MSFGILPTMHRDTNMKDTLLITGLGRNIGGVIEHNVSQLLSSFDMFENIEILVIESDSSDNSIEILKKTSLKYPNFNYISLGTLENRFPDRLDRISYCRNAYMSALRNDPKYRDVILVCVVDFDLLLDALDSKGIGSCFDRDDWSAVFANQLGVYYDIFALRAEKWSPDDCWDLDRILRESGVHPRIAREVAVHSRQKRISRRSSWIPVNSAFGGMAIYRRDVIIKLNYSARDIDNQAICEHVPFNKAISDNGGKLFINPRFTNFSWNDHNNGGRFFRRIRKILVVLLLLLRSRYL